MTKLVHGAAPSRRTFIKTAVAAGVAAPALLRTRSAFERVRLREETLQETARALNVSQTLVHFMVRDAAKHCADCMHAGAQNVAYAKTAGRSKKSCASNVKQMTAS